jgi:hypothetical protein
MFASLRQSVDLGGVGGEGLGEMSILKEWVRILTLSSLGGRIKFQSVSNLYCT